LAGHVERLGEMRNVYIILVRKPEGKRPLGRPRHRWECNIKSDLREVGSEGVDRKDRDQWWALVNIVMFLWFPQKGGLFLHS